MKEKIIMKSMKFLFAIVLVVSTGLSQAAPVTLTPSQDANIGINIDDGSNLSSSTELTVNWWNGSQNVGLLQFDLTPYMGSTLTSGATLNLYHLYNNGLGAVFNLYRNTSAWVPGLDWSSRPTYDPTPVSSLSIGDISQGLWRSADVSAVTQDWLNGTYDNYGFTLERVDQINPLVYFASSGNFDTSLAPQLVLNPVPEPSTYVMLLVGLGLLGFMAKRR